VAAIPFTAGAPRPGIVTLVNPQRPIPADSTRIHGITDAMIGDVPSNAVLPELDRRLAAAWS
jgi:DNA polymerase III epsilon subunit-like protein